MGLVHRVLTSFVEEEELVAQMFQKADGSFWTRAVDGTETQVGSGGGSVPGSAIVRKFPFTFASAGLSDGTDFAAYVPTVGDVILDGWIEVDTAFDGTTPTGDFGPDDWGNVGVLGFEVSGCNMTVDDAGNGVPGSSFLANVTNQSDGVIVNANAGSTNRVLPGKVLSVNPWRVWVTQDGRLNGSDPVSAVGAGTLYLVTATPA